MNKKKKGFSIGQLALNTIFILFSLSYILPFILLISISVASESSISNFGYQFIPKKINFEGYKAVFQNPRQLIDSYIVTIFFSVVATVLSLFFKSLAAYPLSRRNYFLRKQTTWYIFFTMLFGGGMVPTYILITKYLHINDTIWVYILPSLVGAWDIIMMRTFFQGLPEGLVEAAKIDGASELRIYFTIIIPLSTPVLATLGFMFIVAKWNDWNTALLYIDNPKLYSLQFLLQRILREAEFVENMAKQGSEIMGQKVPTETMRYAMAVLAAGPMVIIFPFFQKYFAAGLTIGSIKG